MTESQKTASAARLASEETAKAAEAASTAMETAFDDWMTSMDRQSTHMDEIFADMEDGMTAFSGPMMDAWLDEQKAKLGDNLDDYKEWSAGVSETTDDAVKAYEAAFKAQEKLRLDAAAENAARTQKSQVPMYRNMKAQEDALKKAEEAVKAAEKRYTNQQERLKIIREASPVGNTAGTAENQRRINYWHANIRPNMDMLRDLGDQRGAARDTAEQLRLRIAEGVIPETVRTGYEQWFREQESTWTAEKARIGAFQSGGISGGGLALVGERGPEIVSLPGGARVHPSGTGPGSNQFHFHGAVYGLEDLRRVVVEAVRDHALSGGFRGVFGEA
jgi:hypothetical protein